MANDGFQEMYATNTWTMFKNMIASAERKSGNLTKEHLIAEAIVMIVAGTDTTAVSLSTSLHNMLQQPEVYQRLQDEIRTVMTSIDSRPAFEDLDALPFLDACIKKVFGSRVPVVFDFPGRSQPRVGHLKAITFLPGYDFNMAIFFEFSDILLTFRR